MSDDDDCLLSIKESDKPRVSHHSVKVRTIEKLSRSIKPNSLVQTMVIVGFFLSLQISFLLSGQKTSIKSHFSLHGASTNIQYFCL